jgi:hypothetical protein
MKTIPSRPSRRIVKNGSDHNAHLPLDQPRRWPPSCASEKAWASLIRHLMRERSSERNERPVTRMMVADRTLNVPSQRASATVKEAASVS